MTLGIFINETYNDERALVNLDTNEILLNGDAYHDHIIEAIDGFKMGLKYAGVNYSEKAVTMLNRKNANIACPVDLKFTFE